MAFKNKKSEPDKEEKQEQEDYQLTVNETEIVDMVLGDFDEAEQSRRELMEALAEDQALWEGKREPKSDPWENCSNVNSMISTIVVELIHSKLFPAIWNEELVHWRSEDPNFQENTENVTKFMKAILRRMNFIITVDDMVHDTVKDGTTTHKTRWEIIYKWVQRKIAEKVTYEYIKDEICVVDTVDLKDIFWPYEAKDEQTCEYIIHRSYKKYPELLELQARGYIKNVKENLESNWDQLCLEGAEKEKLDAEGVQKAEGKKRNNHITLLEWYGKYDYNKDGIREECVFLVAKETKTYLSGKPLVAVSKIEKRPFSVGQYIRRSGRLYGRSVLSLVKDLHKELDAIYNQKIDAGTMSIVPFGFYTPASGFKPETQVVAPGTLIPVDDVNSVKFVTVPNNTLASWQDIKFIEGLIEKLTSISSYQMGRQSEIMGTKATATSTVALIREGQTKFTVIGGRILHTVTKILEQILENYQQHMPPNLPYELLGEDGEKLFPQGLSPEEMMGKFTCSITLDAIAFTKDIERQLAIQRYSLGIQNPLIASSPARLWEITADMFKATGAEDVEKLIGKRPEGEYFELDDAKQENMMMLQGKKIDVDPREPLMNHLVTHLVFKKSPAYVNMEPENKMLLEEHIMQTQQVIQQMAAQQMQQQGGMGGEGNVAQGGMGGVPEEPNMGGIPQETPGGQISGIGQEGQLPQG